MAHNINVAMAAKIIAMTEADIGRKLALGECRDLIINRCPQWNLWKCREYATDAFMDQSRVA